jgi:hypothetical protein
LRQARWFGALSLVLGLVALLWPLVLSVLIGSPTLTLWIYGIAILADLALFVLWLILAIRYSQRAANGELFELAYLRRMTGRTPSKS